MCQNTIPKGCNGLETKTEGCAAETGEDAFGISPAPEYFQQYLENEIHDLPGFRTVAVHIFIYGEGENMQDDITDHDKKLLQFLEGCRKKNIKLNREKFWLQMTETPYIGHSLTAEGKARPCKNLCSGKDGPDY